MKRIIRLTESDLARIVKRVIRETKEVDEIFGFKKQKKDGNEHYIKVKNWQGKHDVKFISDKEPKEVNGVVTFHVDKIEDNRQVKDVRNFQVRYFGQKTAKAGNHQVEISDGEQNRLIDKYFGGTISRGNK